MSKRLFWPGNGVASAVATLVAACVSAIASGFGCPANPSCSGDITGDGIVDGEDLGQLLLAWNSDGCLRGTGAAFTADLNGSGNVDGADLGELLLGFGACRFVAGDECESCIAAVTGMQLGSTANNTDSGVNPPCVAAVADRDEWYCWTAPSDGTAVVSTGSPFTLFNTTLAVYSSCSEGASLLACDNDGAKDAASMVDFAATAGVEYRIRVGAVSSVANGSFGLIIDIGSPVCLENVGGNCYNRPGPAGCETALCCVQVCNLDPFCCDVAWDSICAGEAIDNCTTCGKNTDADCFEFHDSAGCNIEACCFTVCETDPFCCNDNWDLECVAAALQGCR